MPLINQKKGKERIGGRAKGTPNKVPALLKECILKAASTAIHKPGGEAGLVKYLQSVARAEPAAFLGLLGKVLPLTIAGDPENPLIVEVRSAAFKQIIERLNELGKPKLNQPGFAGPTIDLTARSRGASQSVAVDSAGKSEDTAQHKS